MYLSTGFNVLLGNSGKGFSGDCSPWNTFGEYYTNPVSLFRPCCDNSFFHLVSVSFTIFGGRFIKY